MEVPTMEPPLTPTKKHPDPSPQEALFFFSVIKHNKGGKLDVDWDALAQETGFKSGSVARTRFGQIKRKLGLDNNSVVPRFVKSPGGVSDGPPSSPVTAGRTKRAPTSAKKVQKSPSKASVKRTARDQLLSKLELRADDENCDDDEDDYMARHDELTAELAAGGTLKSTTVSTYNVDREDLSDFTIKQ